MKSENPLVSYVVPTCNDAKTLPATIRNILGTQEYPFEILVVPNGSSKNWQSNQSQWDIDKRIRVLPLEEPGVCNARNYGLQQATAKYVRFVDDDDFLTQAANQQIRSLEKSGKDVSLGPMHCMDPAGNIYKTRIVPKSNNLTDLMLMPSCNLINPHPFLYRTQSITSHKWDLECERLEDMKWIYDLVQIKEWEVDVVPHPVCIWNEHDGARRNDFYDDVNDKRKIFCKYLLTLICGLDQQHRMTHRRKCDSATLLWKWAYDQHHKQPAYWDEMLSVCLLNSPLGWAPHIFDKSH